MSNSRIQNCNNRCSKCTPQAFNERCCSYPKIETSKDLSLAMGYVPWQYFGNVYEPDKALHIGTMFPELNMPYTGCKGGRCS